MLCNKSYYFEATKIYLKSCPLLDFLEQRSPTFLWQRVTPIIVGWLAASVKITVITV